jgi:hypothetical protein
MLSFVVNLELQDTCHIQMAVCDQNMFPHDLQTLELDNTKMYKELLSRYFDYGGY